MPFLVVGEENAAVLLDLQTVRLAVILDDDADLAGGVVWKMRPCAMSTQ
jgi:hypothetical protein